MVSIDHIASTDEGKGGSQKPDLVARVAYVKGFALGDNVNRLEISLEDNQYGVNEAIITSPFLPPIQAGQMIRVLKGNYSRVEGSVIVFPRIDVLNEKLEPVADYSWL